MRRVLLSATGSPRRVGSFHEHAPNDWFWFCAQCVESDSVVIRRAVPTFHLVSGSAPSFYRVGERRDRRINFPMALRRTGAQLS